MAADPKNQLEEAVNLGLADDDAQTLREELAEEIPRRGRRETTDPSTKRRRVLRNVLNADGDGFQSVLTVKLKQA